MPGKKFVSKDYGKNFAASSRGKKFYETAQEREEAFVAFTQRKLAGEFLGYKLYGLVLASLKAYITYDQGKQPIKINTPFLPTESTTTLREYLGIQEKDLTKDQDQYDESRKAELKAKINALQYIGPLCFMAMLLGDRDVFGPALSNVLVKTDSLQIVKIDPGEVELPIEENKQLPEEVNQKSYTSFLTKFLDTLQGESKSFLPHDQKLMGMPFFNLIFNLLNEEQLRAGIAAIHAFTDETTLKENLNWIAKALGHPEDGIFVKELLDTLKKRAEIILTQFDLENKISAAPFKEIKQVVVKRPEIHFSQPDLDAPVLKGQTNPKVVTKTYSGKKERADFLDRGILDLETLISELDEKMKTLAKDPAKKTKIESLSAAIGEYKALQKSLSDMDKVNISPDDLFGAYKTYEKITSQLVGLLKNDPTEIGVMMEARRKLSDTIKKLSPSKAQFSTLQILEGHQKSFKQILGFFQDTSLKENHHKHEITKGTKGSPPKKQKRP